MWRNIEPFVIWTFQLELSISKAKAVLKNEKCCEWKHGGAELHLLEDRFIRKINVIRKRSQRLETHLDIVGIKLSALVLFCTSYLVGIQRIYPLLQYVSRLTCSRESANHGSRYMTLQTELPNPEWREAEWWIGSWGLTFVCIAVCLCVCVREIERVCMWASCAVYFVWV